ncbi:MAG: hypothetical protein ACR2JB_16195 [Bryobacteraceae bacterium]
MRVDDFAAAPDGSVWAGGNATSRTGQESFFLAHIAPEKFDLNVVQTTPYRPRQLSVKGTGVDGFALTPTGRAFVKIVHSRENGRPDVLYELDRAANDWIPVDISRDAYRGIPMLEGNDGESLLFTGLPDIPSSRFLTCPTS